MRVIDIDPIVEKLKNAIHLGKRIYADTSDLEAILADIEAQPTAEKMSDLISRQAAIDESECPMCPDCPDNCPLDVEE